MTPEVKLLAHQRPPTRFWHAWVLFAGRGHGKTTAAGHFIRGELRKRHGVELLLVGCDFGFINEVMMTPWVQADLGRNRVMVIPPSQLDQIRHRQFDLIWIEEPLEFPAFGAFLDAIERAAIQKGRIVITQGDRDDYPAPFVHFLVRPWTVVTRQYPGEDETDKG